MPESPVFLVTKGKMEEAKKSLLFLRGPKFDVDSELAEIKENVRESQEIGSIGLVTLVKTKHYLVPAIISMVVMFLQQFSGVNAVLAYAVQLFEVGLKNIYLDEPILCYLGCRLRRDS